MRHLPRSSAHRRSTLLGALLTCGLAAAVLPAAAPADEPLTPEVVRLPPPGALLGDGPVDDIVISGTRAYLRGGFEHLGRYTGPTVQLDAASGAVSALSSRLNGQVSDAVPDGRGGFYVAGGFSLAGDAPHANIAHLRADGSVDPAFIARADGDVNALALGDGRLYLGGGFTTVGGQPRAGLAVVDARTGAPLPFAAGTAASAPVTELALAPATDGGPARLYAGSVEAPLRGLDAQTGAALPGFDAGPLAGVRALAVSGERLYVGGAGVSALDAATGRALPGFAAAPFRSGGTVHVLLVDAGRLLAGGDFGGAFGTGRSLVALDPATGAALPGFAPRIGAAVLALDRAYSGPGRPDTQLDTGVFDLVRVGDELWAGGRFGSVAGQRAENLAVLDAATGAARPRALPYLGGQVNALGATPAGRVLLGGNFRIAGARALSALAAVDTRTLTPDPRFGGPGPHPTEGRLLAGPTALVSTTGTEGDNYLEGDVPRYTSNDTPVITRSVVTGARLRPGIAPVHDLSGLALDGRDVILARRLENRPAFPRNVIEVRDPASGRLKRTFPVPLRGYVQTLLVAPDGSLYLGGSFRRKRPSGQQANLAVLRIDPRSGRLYDGFDPHVHGPVGGIAVRGRRIALDGTFDKVPGRRTPSGQVTLDAIDGFPGYTATGALAPLPPTLFGPGGLGVLGLGRPFSSTVAAGGGRRLSAHQLFDLRTGGEDRGELRYVLTQAIR